MPDSAPVVYLLHGDDEFAIAQYLAEFEVRLGDPATVAMNLTRLDGRTYNLEGLLSVAGAMPFLAKRRVVVLSYPLARLNSAPARQKFLELLEKIPPTTALVLVEYSLLTDERDRRQGKIHWLEKWAEGAGERVLVKAFPLPKGALLGRWIQEQARRAGGQFTPQAADLLGSLVGGDPRLADQEIQKLLAYVNYQRAVDIDDVETLTADVGQGDIFAMVDALGNQDGRKALGMYHRLLEQQDPISIFGMVVRQFRLLLLAREVLDGGGNKADVIRELKIHPFVADKLLGQVRRFDLHTLEMIYHRLLDLDEAIKTGEIPADLALDTLVAALTTT
ncbi:MAG: DNA polymerase III subunit delta [Chloroflexota bacterium]